jgi:hypothetical protein
MFWREFISTTSEVVFLKHAEVFGVSKVITELIENPQGQRQLYVTQK